MGRDVDYRNQGVAQFFEARANGVNIIGLRAPAVVAANIDIELLATLPGSTQVLTISSTGQMGTTPIGAGDLDDSYDFPTPGAGRTITADSGAVAITVPVAGGNDGLIVDQNDDFIGIEVTKDGAGAGSGVKVTNAGTGLGVEVIQNGVAVGFQVTQNAAAVGLAVIQNAIAVGLTVVQNAAAIGLTVTQNAVADAAQIIQTQNDNALFIQKTAVGGGDALVVQNLGTGDGVSIDQDAVGFALDIDVAVASTAAAVRVVNAGTGPGVLIDQDGVAIALDVDQGANAIGVRINKSAAGAGVALSIINAGTATGLALAQNGTGRAFDITKISAELAVLVTTLGGQGIQINSPSGGVPFFIDQDGNDTALFVDCAAVSTSAGLLVIHAGTGEACFLDQNGNGAALVIDSEATGEALINLFPITGNSRGDIAFGAARSADPATPSEGDIWYNNTTLRLMLKNSSAQLRGFGGRFGPEFGPEVSQGIVGGVVTPTRGNLQVTSQSGPNDDLDTLTAPTDILIGDEIRLRTNVTDNITVKHNTGNIRLDANVDKTLTNRNRLTLMWDGTDWVQVGPLVTMA